MDEPLFVHSIVVKSPEQVSRAIDEECVILNVKNSVYYSLDPVGAHVWNLLREPRSVAELRDSLLVTYDVEAGRCERNLLELLDQMRAQGLAEVRGALRSPETLGMDEPAQQEQKALPKKPYSPPKLITHGTVDELTKANGAHGQLDGGIRNRNRTRV
jgi:coenzyme PQQ synthesis protein D (PqqD)